MSEELDRFVLHIGTPKTGTTFVQGILAQNRQELLDAGWAYPGKRLNQQHAMYGLCGPDIYSLQNPAHYAEIGRTMADRVQAHLAQQRRVVVSAETLAKLDDTGGRATHRSSGCPRPHRAHAPWAPHSAPLDLAAAAETGKD